MQETLAATSHFAQLSQDTGFRTMLSLFLPQLRLDAQAIKLQYNAGQSFVKGLLCCMAKQRNALAIILHFSLILRPNFITLGMNSVVEVKCCDPSPNRELHERMIVESIIVGS